MKHHRIVRRLHTAKLYNSKLNVAYFGFCKKRTGFTHICQVLFGYGTMKNIYFKQFLG